MNVDELEHGEKVAFGGAAMVVFGALLPWTAGGAASGFAGNGIFTLVFALFAVGLVATSDWERETHLAVLGLGVLTTVVAMVALPDASAIVNPGAGLYLTAAGGVVVACGGGFGYVSVDARERMVEPTE